MLGQGLKDKTIGILGMGNIGQSLVPLMVRCHTFSTSRPLYTTRRALGASSASSTRHLDPVSPLVKTYTGISSGPPCPSSRQRCAATLSASFF